MLINVNPLLSPDILATLRSMGHGDRFVLSDANFPSFSHTDNLLRMDGYTDKDLMNEIELLKVMFYNDMIKNCYITIYIPI